MEHKRERLTCSGVEVEYIQYLQYHTLSAAEVKQGTAASPPPLAPMLQRVQLRADVATVTPAFQHILSVIAKQREDAKALQSGPQFCGKTATDAQIEFDPNGQLRTAHYMATEMLEKLEKADASSMASIIKVAFETLANVVIIKAMEEAASNKLVCARRCCLCMLLLLFCSKTQFQRPKNKDSEAKKKDLKLQVRTHDSRLDPCCRRLRLR